MSAKPKLPDGFNPRMVSFDVYGTLVNTPPANLRAFQSILADAGRTDLDAQAFYSFWEQRNIAHYYEPYRSYKEICRLSLSEAFEKFGVATGREEMIQRFFDCVSSMELYPDVLPTLEVLARHYRLALVSNIDDDLLNATPLGREFDLVCTAERARLQAGWNAVPLSPEIIGNGCVGDPALRAVAVHRHGRRQAAWPHGCLDQPARPRSGCERSPTRSGPPQPDAAVRAVAASVKTGRVVGAGEGIRTLDPDLGKVVLYP